MKYEREQERRYELRRGNTHEADIDYCLSHPRVYVMSGSMIWLFETKYQQDIQSWQTLVRGKVPEFMMRHIFSFFLNLIDIRPAYQIVTMIFVLGKPNWQNVPLWWKPTDVENREYSWLIFCLYICTVKNSTYAKGKVPSSYISYTTASLHIDAFEVLGKLVKSQEYWTYWRGRVL